MSVNKSFHAFITVVTYTYVTSVKKFRKLVVWRKVFANKCKKSRAMFVLTFLLNGGLNHKMFLCLLR